MPPSTQTRRILLKVDTTGSRELKELADKLGGIAKNTKSLAGGFNLLKNSFLGYVSALGIRELAQMSDEMQNLGNRLKIVSQAGEDTTKIMDQILAVADRTNQSVTAVGEAYTRMAVSLKAAGASAESLLVLTESLINSFRIAGSTNTETTATIIQLTQAFASGTLRGQELRSVMLQNATVAGLLREKFGKGLAKAAEDGLVTPIIVLELMRDNLKKVNDAAAILAPTFGQVITKAFNRAQIALFKLNEEFKLSSKFASLLDGLTSRLSLLGVVAATLALTQIPALITSVQALGVAMLTLATRNPLLLALLATSAVVISTNSSLGELIDRFRNMGAWLAYLKTQTLEFSYAIDKALGKALFKVGLGSDTIINDLAKQLDEITNFKKLTDELATPKYRPSPLLPPTEDDQVKSLQKLIDQLKSIDKLSPKILKPKEFLALLNAEFATGSILIDEYNSKLLDFQKYKLDKEFKEGKIDLEKYNEGLNKISENKLNDALKDGTITLRKYNAEVNNLKLEELDSKFQAGKITLVEYNNELVKISQKFEPGSALIAGTSSYIESVGTLSQGIAGAISNTFKNLEDQLLDFIKKGKFDFAQFTQSILDDLTKIIIRASIVQPLANGILSSFGAPQASGVGADFNPSLAAKGLAFDKGLTKFAAGGVVNSPTMFKYGGGTGIMGEAGPEAILPLRRGSGGNLGVTASVTPVNIQIINQSGGEVQKSETTGPGGEKSIEILILGKVKDGIMSGQLDKTMNSAYGLNRRGL